MGKYPEEVIYEVFWEGPFKLEDLKEYAKSEPDLANYWSLYAKYEDHPIYGREVLTYIGKAINQTVLTRLGQHDLDFENVFVGVIYNFTDWKSTNETFKKKWKKHKDFIVDDGSIISSIEELLIYALWPAGNLRNKNSARNSENIRIFNTGYHGSITPEISGHYVLETLPATLKIKNTSQT